ncbi:unnamed protein product [Polarella glacialis]|uniref:Uncharacterized protein n=1 Tax=Polarella glacialis TaxID=89957 RepID=A0A813FCW3_POLGL|nr:unnamed protein product [Polarella glacialis]
MQPWANTIGGRPPATKRAKKEGPGTVADPPYTALLVLTAKQVMHNSAHVREHDAALQHVIILPAAHPVCESLQLCGRQYATDAKNKSPTEHGSPHLHMWAALISVLGNLTNLDETQRTQLTVHAQAMVSPQKLAQCVFVCKLSKAWIRDNFKFTISFAPSMEALADLVCTVLPRMEQF